MSQYNHRRINIEPGSALPGIVHISEASIEPSLLRSLTQLMTNCFGTPEVGVYLPSLLYLLFVDSQVVATVFLTSLKTALPLKYQSVLNSHYIYNVCTYSPYRGRGLMRSVLTSALADIAGLSKTSPVIFYLTVDPANLPAYRLYTSLGFVKIDQVDSNRSAPPKFDLLEYAR